MISEGDTVTVALSGGADSVCLLFLLKESEEELKINVRAAHVEHGIRGEESIGDMEFCKELCEKLGVPLSVKQVDVPAYVKETGKSTEEAARDLRYEALRETGYRIALAHHADDNAETMLFQLIRGTAYRGLSGMDPVRGDLIRPLLFATREEIEAYLKEKEQPYCTDSTNADTELSRNKIRHEVIPLLKEINERAVEHMGHSAEILKELIKEHDYRLKNLEETCFSEDKTKLLRKPTAAQPDFIQRELISLYLRENLPHLKDVSDVHIRAVQGILTGPSNRVIEIPHKVALRAEKEWLCIVPQKPKKI